MDHDQRDPRDWREAERPEDAAESRERRGDAAAARRAASEPEAAAPDARRRRRRRAGIRRGPSRQPAAAEIESWPSQDAAPAVRRARGARAQPSRDWPTEPPEAGEAEEGTWPTSAPERGDEPIAGFADRRGRGDRRRGRGSAASTAAEAEAETDEAAWPAAAQRPSAAAATSRPRARPRPIRPRPPHGRRGRRGRPNRAGRRGGDRREHPMPALRDREPAGPRLLPQLRSAARGRGRGDHRRAAGDAGGDDGLPALRDAQPRRRRLLPELRRQPARHRAGLRPAGGGRRARPPTRAAARDGGAVLGPVVLLIGLIGLVTGYLLPFAYGSDSLFERAFGPRRIRHRVLDRLSGPTRSLADTIYFGLAAPGADPGRAPARPRGRGLRAGAARPLQRSGS